MMRFTKINLSEPQFTPNVIDAVYRITYIIDTYFEYGQTIEPNELVKAYNSEYPIYEHDDISKCAMYLMQEEID
jgi:hypothetical protein